MIFDYDHDVLLQWMSSTGDGDDLDAWSERAQIRAENAAMVRMLLGAAMDGLRVRYWPVCNFPESAAPDAEIPTGTIRHLLRVKQWTADG